MGEEWVREKVISEILKEDHVVEKQWVHCVVNLRSCGEREEEAAKGWLWRVLDTKLKQLASYPIDQWFPSPFHHI